MDYLNSDLSSTLSQQFHSASMAQNDSEQSIFLRPSTDENGTFRVNRSNDDPRSYKFPVVTHPSQLNMESLNDMQNTFASSQLASSLENNLSSAEKLHQQSKATSTLDNQVDNAVGNAVGHALRDLILGQLLRDESCHLDGISSSFDNNEMYNSKLNGIAGFVNNNSFIDSNAYQTDLKAEVFSRLNFLPKNELMLNDCTEKSFDFIADDFSDSSVGFIDGLCEANHSEIIRDRNSLATKPNPCLASFLSNNCYSNHNDKMLQYLDKCNRCNNYSEFYPYQECCERTQRYHHSDTIHPFQNVNDINLGRHMVKTVSAANTFPFCDSSHCQENCNNSSSDKCGCCVNLLNYLHKVGHNQNLLRCGSPSCRFGNQQSFINMRASVVDKCLFCSNKIENPEAILSLLNKNFRNMQPPPKAFYAALPSSSFDAPNQNCTKCHSDSSLLNYGKFKNRGNCRDSSASMGNFLEERIPCGDGDLLQKASVTNKFEKKPSSIKYDNASNNRHSNDKNTWKRCSKFYKTKMCPHVEKQECCRGLDCAYAHNIEELRELPNLEKTKMCPNSKSDGKCTDIRCAYAHDRDELRHTENLYKTKMCHLWKKGKCTADELCRHAHGSHELKQQNMIKGVKNSGPNHSS